MFFFGFGLCLVTQSLYCTWANSARSTGLSCETVPLLYLSQLCQVDGAVLWHSPFIVGVVPGPTEGAVLWHSPFIVPEPTLPGRRNCLVTQSLYCGRLNLGQLGQVDGVVLWHSPFIVGGCTWANSDRSTGLSCDTVPLLYLGQLCQVDGDVLWHSPFIVGVVPGPTLPGRRGCLVTQSLNCGCCSWANSARSTGLSCDTVPLLWVLYLGQLCHVDGAVLWHSPFIVPGPTLPGRQGCRTGPGAGSWGSAEHTASPLAKQYHTLSP